MRPMPFSALRFTLIILALALPAMIAAQTPELISFNAAETDTGDGFSGSPRVSADGRFVVFQSFASNLVPTDTNGGSNTGDIFVRDRVLGITILVSVNSSGADSGNGTSSNPVISADGRFVAFESDASDLVAADTNGATDIFVRDLVAGTTTLVSANSAGTDSGSSASTNPRISDDGSLVVFESLADDLVATDSNGASDVFLRDLGAGTTDLLSVNMAGTDSGNGASHNPQISGDGSVVAFESDASDLVATDTNGGTPATDVFARNLGAGTTALVSINSGGTDSGSGLSVLGRFSISQDGNLVVFASEADDLVANDTSPATQDIYLRNLGAGTTALVSVNTTGDGGSGSSLNPVISADGSTVAFESFADDLVATDTTGFKDVFARSGGATTLVSINSGGTDAANGASSNPVISDDGRFVAYVSDASDLVGTDTNTSQDVFVRDRMGAATFLASVNSAGTDSGSGTSSAAALAGDGSLVAFSSDAGDLVATDTNSGNTFFDVFVFVPVTPSTGSLSGFVYIDANNDGVRDPGEVGIAGVTVTLSGDAAAMTTTAADGSYSFTGLAAGTYTITETQPANLADGLDAVGSAGGILTNDMVTGISLGAGVIATDYNFGERGSVLTGFVYIDADNDGVFDAGEVGLSGVTVTLTGTDSMSNPVNVVTVTAGGGAYAFNNLLPGTYTITETQPAGIADGMDTVGSAGGTLGNDVISNIMLTGIGVLEGGYNFGESAGSLTGRVFLDSNANGVRDAGETGISGVTVTLTGNDVNGAVNRMSTTNASGDFFFTVLRQGTYTLTETGPADFLDGADTPCTVPAGSTGGTAGNDVISNISLAAGASGICNFGELATVSVSIDDVTVAEGNAGSTNATFTVTLSGMFTRDVTANFATANGTATASSPVAASDDYTAATGMITIPAGSTTATIQVPILGDATQESDETFVVNLSSVTNAAVADSQGRGTIADDDPPFRISASPATTSSTPVSIVAGQSATFTVTVTAMPPPFNEAVALSCSGLPELASCAFTPPSVTPGATFATSTLVISTIAPQNALSLPFSREQSAPLYALAISGISVLGMVLAGCERRRTPRRRRLRAYLWGSLLLMLLALAGCGSTSVGTRTGGPFTVTVTASSSQGVRTTSIFLNVR